MDEALAAVSDDLLTIVSTGHLADAEPSRSENHPTRLATESIFDADDNTWDVALLDVLEQEIT